MRISSQARIYAAGIALVLGLAGVAAHAQPSPAGPRAEAPLHIIVGYAPGGAADSVARAYAEQVRLDTGGTVIVENRPGASARLALEYVKQSKPDGRTIFLGPSPLFTVFPLTYRHLSYDADRDLAPVAVLTDIPTAVSAGKGQPYANMAEYVEWIKKNPKAATIGLATVGNTLQLGTFEVGRQVGVEITPVAYKGASPMLVDVISGRVSIGADALASQMELYKGGKLNLLGVSGSTRARSAPEVPTMLEQGFAQYQYATSWYAAFVPAATPADVIGQLEGILVKASASPDMIARLGAIGLEVVGLPGAQASKRIAQERAYWAPIVKASGMELND